MTTKSHGRAAACTAAAIFGVSAGFQFYWGMGGTWGLHDASGGTAPPLSASEQIGVVIIGLVFIAFAGVLLVRVGCWREHVPFAIARFARINAWVIAVVPLGGALAKLRGSDGCPTVRRWAGQPHRRAAGLRGRAFRAAAVAQERSGAAADWRARPPRPA